MAGIKNDIADNNIYCVKYNCITRYKMVHSNMYFDNLNILKSNSLIKWSIPPASVGTSLYVELR